MTTFAYRVWDKWEKQYVSTMFCYVSKTGTLYINERPVSSMRYETELWTGLQDENKKAVYENDVLEAPNGHRSTVIFKNGGFVLDDGKEISTLYPYKVVGRKE